MGRWHGLKVAVTGLCVALAAGAVMAEDWNQWRGPRRDGVVADGPALVDSWSASGPTEVWNSAPIPGGGDGGFSSVTIADGRAYVFVNWKRHEPIATRAVDEKVLRRVGWFPEALPAELSAAVEAARVSDERTNLNRKDVKAWIEKWVSEHLPDEAQRKKLGGQVTNRLNRGKNAMSLETLAKLAGIKDKEFPSADALNKWLDANGITGNERGQVLSAVPTKVAKADDVMLCLSAADGKELWRKQYPGEATDYGSSSTATVTGGRCYVAGTRTLYCFDAKDGTGIWKAPLESRETSSSPAVVNGMVILQAKQLTAFDERDGRQLWTQKKVGGATQSPAVWRSGDRTWLLCNAGRVSCVDAATGEVAWSVPGGGHSSPTVAGDVMVIFGSNAKVGVSAYRMTPEKAESLWAVPFADRGATLLIHDGCVYGVGSNKVFCISLDKGDVKWEQKATCEIASPIIADGKLLGIVESGKRLLMVRASPATYELLGEARLGIAAVSSPVVCDGRLYLRRNKSVTCYDLRRP